MSRTDEVHDLYDRLCWLCSPVCLEGREEAREEAPSFRSLVGLVRKTGRALFRMLGGPTPGPSPNPIPAQSRLLVRAAV